MRRVLWFLLLLPLLYGCQAGEITGISQLAETPTPVYLTENGNSVPYLVITKDYDGNTLLLRRDVLAQGLSFHDSSSSYYPESSPDSFLNSTFLTYFPAEFQQLLCEADIPVCRAYPNVTQTEFIRRKVFLLSCTEVGLDLGIITQEGQPLSFFENSQSLTADMAWWLRSAYAPDRGLVWCIGTDGTAGSCGVQLECGLRPALCVPGDTPVALEQLENGLTGYTIQYTQKE